jgi:hypothetical protein
MWSPGELYGAQYSPQKKRGTDIPDWGASLSVRATAGWPGQTSRDPKWILLQVEILHNAYLASTLISPPWFRSRSGLSMSTSLSDVFSKTRVRGWGGGGFGKVEQEGAGWRADGIGISTEAFQDGVIFYFIFLFFFKKVHLTKVKYLIKVKILKVENKIISQ